MNGYWTQRELAMIVGLDQFGESVEEIALMTDRHPMDVRNGLRMARAFMPPRGDGSPASSETLPVGKDHPDRVVRSGTLKRRYRVSPHLADIQRLSAQNPTGQLFGDPAPGRSALDQKKSQSTLTGDRP